MPQHFCWYVKYVLTVFCLLTHGLALSSAGLSSAGLAAERTPPSNSANLPLGLQLEKLTVAPAEIELHAANRRQQILVTAHSIDGREWDVTRQCQISVSDSSLASVNGSLLAARVDGTTIVRVSLGDLQADVPLLVHGCEESPPIHFATDIIPVFSQLGCNGGGCHGRVQGQNGFKLSVFGYDPIADYQAILKESRGRRVFPGSPRNSLLLQKASARVPHGGGMRMAEDSVEYDLLHRWISQGAPLGDDSAPQLQRLEVVPTERVLTAGAEQQLLVTACFSDGTRRDVTHSAHFASNATNVSEVNLGGLVRCGELSGEAAVTINYMGQVAVARILRPRAGLLQPFPAVPTNNPIDKLVWRKLESMGFLPSELADDATFLRRLFLDVIGTPPSAHEVRQFLSETDPLKRSRWIDAVLERPEYADYWALKWADILLIDKGKLGDRGAFEFHRWLRNQFEHNRPYHQWVRDIIIATGNSGRSGPVNFYRAADTADELARTISQAFLGVRLECAQCHHHPFDRWSQSDFYGMAGFFQGLERKQLSTDRTLLFHPGYRPTTIPIANITVPTRPLGSETIPDLSRGDPRAVLANWVVQVDNPWFARMFANRLWKQLLGRGLVEPEDDMRVTNPATNEPLLAHLSQQAVESGFDQKALLRSILNTRIYQTSSVPNSTNYDDEQNFSHYYVKRLPAEVLLDAISIATDVPESFPGQPKGTRAIQLWDNRLPSYFLEIFGRPPRNSPCECGRSSEPTMAQALHLTNAPEVEAKISHPAGRIAALLTADKIPGNQVPARQGLSQQRPSQQQVSQQALREQLLQQVIEEICLVTAGRLPNNKEQRVAAELFRVHESEQAAQDFLWTMLNSYDFLFIQ